MKDWNKTAVLFPGQGSQVLGMGRDFAHVYPSAARIFQQADAALGFPLSRICWDGPERELNRTINTQPALYVCGMAIWRALLGLMPSATPAWMAGHSLGEFTALAAAGAMSFEDGLRLVYTRARLMEQAGDQNPGAMAALLALDASQVEALCAEVSGATDGIVVLSNDNCPGQVVVSGHNAAVDAVLERAPALGAKRAVKLAVSVAAHSPLMASASADFADAVRKTPFEAPASAIIGNVNAVSLPSVAAIRAELEQQLTRPVRWTDSMRNIIAQGAESFVEIGPGKVLSGLMRRIDRTPSRIALDSVDALEGFLRSQG